MKRLFVVIVLIVSVLTSVHGKTNFVKSDFFGEMKEGDKAAILMVHFGTSHNDTRAKTIDALNGLVGESFAGVELRQAWTSRIVIRILKGRGEVIPTPLEALEQLNREGYTHVLVQSSNIIEGIEMESLRRDVAAISASFKDVRVGNPLLYSVDDYRVIADDINSLKPKGSAIVLVGHGTYTPTTAQYAMLDYMIKDSGYGSIHIGTIEGYPTYDTMLRNLKNDRVKRVLLMPFMFVAGEHAKNDIALDWRESLESEGYKVDVLMKGLGERKAVQQLFIDHIKFISQNKMYDIMEKKKRYLKGDM